MVYAALAFLAAAAALGAATATISTASNGSSLSTQEFELLPTAFSWQFWPGKTIQNAVVIRVPTDQGQDGCSDKLGPFVAEAVSSRLGQNESLVILLENAHFLAPCSLDHRVKVAQSFGASAVIFEHSYPNRDANFYFQPYGASVTRSFEHARSHRYEPTA